MELLNSLPDWFIPTISIFIVGFINVAVMKATYSLKIKQNSDGLRDHRDSKESHTSFLVTGKYCDGRRGDILGALTRVEDSVTILHGRFDELLRAKASNGG